MAQKFIEALYMQGAGYRDDFVTVPTEMYALVSAAPVLRHITRQSGAVIYVTVYGSAHVRQTGILSLFPDFAYYLAHKYTDT